MVLIVGNRNTIFQDILGDIGQIMLSKNQNVLLSKGGNFFSAIVKKKKKKLSVAWMQHGCNVLLIENLSTFIA